ncbi:arginine--tRNA ligase [Desulfobacterium sp. N47]|uniref:Arginine--tRNA ligase n=1 Tax=uncultured Desulfobacterium sp. TaxID=201089 RepID=E1YFN1_9BACT|nr:Arginyl-tRNA synthetase [uncultured Desulfobacterium sp.]
MKNILSDILLSAAKKAFDKQKLASSDFPAFGIEEPKLSAHGDFSSNFAMVMASLQKMPPRKIAEAITAEIEDTEGVIDKIEIAGPGFINFFINPCAWHSVLRTIYEKDEKFGSCDIGKNRKVQVEFVSANPTGPLHVGHGRGAAVGDSTANILSFCGYDVQREYYINDSGRQISTLGRSVYLRYKELHEEKINFPGDCYQGDYIRDIAQKIKNENQIDLLDEPEEKAVMFCARFAADDILADIKNDLELFGVKFDNWYSEQSLFDSGKVKSVLEDFKNKNIIYEKDGAFWFKTSEYGDEKDRVVIRNNGLTTYFASDIAYHIDKFDRGFERIVDVWGADHHGYIQRICASIEASGQKEDQFNVILIQLVNLLRNGEPVAMSTRSGEFVTLEDVVKEVGADAARFIFLTRHYESHLDFDLELAKKKSNENPVYYVQYVHARISSIIRKADELGVKEIRYDDKNITVLKEAEEIQILKILSTYPEVVKSSAELLEPHRITYYLMNLAAAFHSYYNKCRVLSDDPVITKNRLFLVLAIKKVIRNGLKLLGVSAPEIM